MSESSMREKACADGLAILAGRRSVRPTEEQVQVFRNFDGPEVLGNPNWTSPTRFRTEAKP